MFENFENPTEFDYELIKILYRYMTKEERQAFATTIQKSFSQNDLIATKELAKTILATTMEIQMAGWHGGKGSSQRPMNVSKSKFDDNWDAIFGKKKEQTDLDVYNDERLVSKFDKDGRTVFSTDTGNLSNEEVIEFVQEYKKTLDNNNE